MLRVNVAYTGAKNFLKATKTNPEKKSNIEVIFSGKCSSLIRENIEKKSSNTTGHIASPVAKSNTPTKLFSEAAIFIFSEVLHCIKTRRNSYSIISSCISPIRFSEGNGMFSWINGDPGHHLVL